MKREVKGGPECEYAAEGAAQPLANHTPANESPHVSTGALFHFSTFARCLPPPVLLKLSEAELVSEREAVLYRTESFGGSGVLQASGGTADGEAEAFLDSEAFV